LSDRVLRITASVPPSQVALDLREHINTLSEDEIWSTLRACSHALHLNVSGWTSIDEKPLRSIAIVLGDNLESLDLSHTNISNAMIQIIASRMYSLKTVRLAHCESAGSAGVRDLVASCSDSLTHLDFSGCPLVDDDALGWVAGCLGYQRPPCKKLTTLNLSHCTAVQDEGLVHLSKGCPRLQFINLTSCTQVLLLEIGGGGAAVFESH
jgi:hypothetical protein